VQEILIECGSSILKTTVQSRTTSNGALINQLIKIPEKMLIQIQATFIESLVTEFGQD
jgi:hypothetical protein